MAAGLCLWGTWCWPSPAVSSPLRWGDSTRLGTPRSHCWPGALLATVWLTQMLAGVYSSDMSPASESCSGAYLSKWEVAHTPPSLWPGKILSFSGGLLFSLPQGLLVIDLEPVISTSTNNHEVTTLSQALSCCKQLFVAMEFCTFAPVLNLAAGSRSLVVSSRPLWRTAITILLLSPKPRAILESFTKAFI